MINTIYTLYVDDFLIAQQYNSSWLVFYPSVWIQSRRLRRAWKIGKMSSGYAKCIRPYCRQGMWRWWKIPEKSGNKRSIAVFIHEWNCHLTEPPKKNEQAHTWYRNLTVNRSPTKLRCRFINIRDHHGTILLYWKVWKQRFNPSTSNQFTHANEVELMAHTNTYSVLN